MLKNGLREHEKFWAFMALGAGVLILAVMVMFKTPENEYALRILDAAVGGFLLALGSAANALFRVGTQEEKDIAATGRALAEAQPKEVHVTNTRSDPVPTEASAEPTSEEKAPWDKQ